MVWGKYHTQIIDLLVALMVFAVVVVIACSPCLVYPPLGFSRTVRWQRCSWKNPTRERESEKQKEKPLVKDSTTTS